MSNAASAAITGPERKLVSIEIQKELDVFSKKWEDRVFVKLYVAARTSGLMAAMSDRDWKTLSVLATFMNAFGECFPSQAMLARALGIHRGTANERIQSLARFRFEGKPVLLVRKQSRDSKNGIRFAANHYTILPVTKLEMFEGASATPRRDRRSPVSPFPDTGAPDTEQPDAAEPDTNNR